MGWHTWREWLRSLSLVPAPQRRMAGKWSVSYCGYPICGSGRGPAAHPALTDAGPNHLDRPLPVVPHLPARGLQHGADPIRLPEVARGLRVLAPHRPADGPRALMSLVPTRRRRFGELLLIRCLRLHGRSHLEHLHCRGHAQHPFGAAPGGDGAGPGGMPGIERRVARRREREERSYRARRVQVVIERFGQLPVEPVGGLDQRGSVLGARGGEQPVLELPQPARALPGAGKRLVGQIELPPIVNLKQQQPDGARVHAVLPKIPGGRDIAVPLGHLLAADLQELPVKPDSCELIPPGVGTALSDLVLMVREDQVHPTGVDVQYVRSQPAADELQRHCRALDVPSGAAAAEGRVPGGTDRLVFGTGGLPQYEVAGIFLGVLVGTHPLARASAELSAVELRQASVLSDSG